MTSENFHVTIRETITYQREFTRPELARLLADSLDNIEDTELIARVTGNPAVEEALQRYGDVQLDSWHVSAADHPNTDEADRHEADPRATAPEARHDTHDHATAAVPGRT